MGGGVENKGRRMSMTELTHSWAPAAAAARRRRPRLSALWRNTGGAAAIEFAFIAVPFLVSILGVTEYGRILWTRNSLQNAANETAHYAMIHGTATQQQLVSYAQAAAAPLDPNSLTIQVTWNTAGGTTYVTILMTCQTGIGIPFLPKDSVTLVGRARTPQIS
jgi:Flp pilus assembly protein TadG